MNVLPVEMSVPDDRELKLHPFDRAALAYTVEMSVPDDRELKPQRGRRSFLPP